MTQVYYCNRYTSLRIREVMTSRLCTNQKSQGEISTLTTHIDVDHIMNTKRKVHEDKVANQCIGSKLLNITKVQMPFSRAIVAHCIFV